jgi:chromosome segregation ATPase
LPCKVAGLFFGVMPEVSSQQSGGSRRSRGTTRVPLMAAPAIGSRSLAEERAQLDADLAELRESEANLRVLEQRLRAMQAEIDAAKSKRPPTQPPRATARAKTATRPPFSGDSSSLQVEWDKLIRARELLESEQAHLRGDRIALRDETAVVRRRAQAVAEREAKVAEREQQLLATESVGGSAAPSEIQVETERTAPIFAKLIKGPRALLNRSGV